MESRHVKSINTDARSNKRIKFASAKERSKRASADVYRSHKRKIGATSATTREEAVHNPRRENSARKRQRSHHVPVDGNKGKTAVLKIAKDDEVLPDVEDRETLDLSSSLAEELDETLDRNGSEIFGKFHRQVWPLVRSLPEILHHSGKIVDLMLSHMLSPESAPERPSDLTPSSPEKSVSKATPSSSRGYVVNLATLDILHLMAVLARDLRHEIHPFLDKILSRLVQDMLNPPPPPPDSGKQPIPLDVTLVEAAFRCMSYIFRYDADRILENIESMRKYYGATLAVKRELTRRLASETFAPLIRKLKSQTERQRHLKRVFKALVTAMGNQPVTPQFKRMQDDAVDGISQLLFQIVRGVPGRLHSQGSATVQFVLSYCAKTASASNDTAETKRDDVLLSIASSFLHRLFYHLDKTTAQSIVGMLCSVLKSSLAPDSVADSGFEPALNALRLLSKTVASGRGMAAVGEIEDRQDFFGSLDGFFTSGCFRAVSLRAREEVASLLCPIWLSLQVDDGLENHFQGWLGVMLDVNEKDASEQEVVSIRNVTAVLARQLIPNLTNRDCLDKAGSAALSAAARIAHFDADSALLTIFALASKQLEDEGRLFVSSGVAYKVPENIRQTLLDVCLFNFDKMVWNQTNVEKMAVAIRCVPFIAMLQSNEGSEKDRKELFKKSSAWYIGVINSARNVTMKVKDDGSMGGLVLILALGLEGLSCLSSSYLESSGDVATVQKSVRKVIETAENVLYSNVNSMWAVRGVASLVGLLSRLDMTLNDKCDETFDVLVANLSNPSHALRLHTLQILAAYPTKNFVTDHAELELDGDLDEDPSFHPEGNDYSRSRGLVGKCDIMATLLQIESMKVRLTEERPLLGLVSRVEVLARTGKLPVIYAECAASHMLGLFHVKFAPLWHVARNALVTLTKSQEHDAWPALEAKLVSVMKPPNASSEESSATENELALGYAEHHLACIQWEKSQGRLISVFGALPTVQDGEVYRHLTTDEGTVVESVWEVAEKCQQQVAKHSRVIVPVFLEFLTNQFFFFHADDPSARELRLDKPSEDSSADRSLLHKYDLQKKLLCFLRVFAAVDGPQQMVQHQLLEKIFRSFLTHQETSVVQLSLSCLMKFKRKHLISHRDLLTGLLERGRLREAILKFQEAIEAEKIEKDDYRLLVPIVSRILFGRLSVRESRSAKDSPAAKRAAILSFISIVCPEDDQLFSFVYLMTRSFIPRDHDLKEVEDYTKNEQIDVLGILGDVDAVGIKLPNGVIEGFLHLVQAVVAQLGHRIKTYIPTITSIVLALCRVAAVGEDMHTVDADPDVIVETTANDDDHGMKDGLRRGAIRTLCFQRLSEIFAMYALVIDFERFGGQLWAATSGSVALLPQTVVKSERVPAFLQMIETLSSSPSLIPVLCMNEASIVSVIRCIKSTSQTAVMISVLSVIENLLEATAGPDGGCIEVVASHIPLLVEQFTDRLKGGDKIDGQAKPEETPKGSTVRLRQATWRKELQILCRLSELIGDEKRFEEDGRCSILDDLSELLLPFLGPGQGTSDDDKLNVLGILKSTAGKLQPATLGSVYKALSAAMGPIKGKPGIESIPVRKEVADVLAAVSKESAEFKRIAQVVAKMSASNPKRVDEVDFETVIPELNALGKETEGCAWEDLGDTSPINLAPIVSICFHYLYNEDGVLARASFNALKSLVSVAARKSEFCPGWTRLVESMVVPPARSGLQSRSVAIRRFYILIIRETAKCFRDHDSPNLCGDLNALIDEENPDLDFFVGITHVQMHRRGRAFQRLRKVLKEDNALTLGLTSQSLSSILLPLAIHPAYESKMKVEEGFALEGIATVGAIARHLPWNKYQNSIGSILSSFDRHPQQERYLIGALCAIIDAFRFDLVLPEDDKADSNEGTVTGKTAVWRALEKRFIPKLEGLLTKEKTDKNGTKSKIIRPPVVLALMKLFQKFPEEFFEAKLPHILTVICDALRSRESDARDLARTTIAKIVTDMDLKYLSDVVRELTITLNEGYKLHVRAAVIHTILQELSIIHKPPDADSLSKLPPSSFDSSIPALMDVLQEDLFGEANERRESQDTSVRYVKEAGGSKSVHSIEMICRMIRFKPSDAKDGSASKSSIHCVVGPLLERLRLHDVTASTIRKIKEILQRVVIGLSHNPSVGPVELFPFVYATIQPFISTQTIAAVMDENDEDDADESLKVSSAGRDAMRTESKPKSGKVVEWRPSSLKHAQSSRAAIDSQRTERLELRRVKDGASAPKLTGTGRHGLLDVSDSHGLNNPATISAVVFGLNLLHSSLKKLNLKQEDDDKELIGMMDPFVPMLTACICNCKDNDVALVAMKCVMSLLRFELPSFAKCSKSLGTQALTFLSSSGTSLNQNNDMTQACFRTLTYLINRDRNTDDEPHQRPIISGAEGEEVLSGITTMPLNGGQMKVLISFLAVSVAESDQHNPALSLIKAIVSRKFTSPEFYDLMESMLKVNVRSQRASLRQQSAGVFIRYLLDYPMGEARFEQHLKQVVANISYEYQDGRLSAIEMLTAIIEKLPDELLERHAQLLFMPLVLQLVNDDAKECREAVATCLSKFLARSSTEVVQSFHNYATRWCSGDGPMQVASLQIFGIFVESCGDFLRANNHVSQWIDRLTALLQKPRSAADEWEAAYFSLICVEKLAIGDEPSLFSEPNVELWNCIVERLVDSHPWIKLASCRIIQKLFASSADNTPKLLERTPGMLFEIIKNLCFQLNVEEEEQSEDLSENAIKTLTLALPLAHSRPDLCFTADSPHAGLRNPLAWTLRRLSAIAKPKGRQRRMAIFKCFAAFCTRHPDVILRCDDTKQRQQYLEFLLEPLHRSDLEANNELENPHVLHKSFQMTSTSTGQKESAVMTESTLARDVLQLIEEGCNADSSADVFLQAYAAVKSRARDKKDQRKVEAKALAVQDPAAAALKKTKKHKDEKERRKRRVDERRHDRGAQKKQRNHG